MTLLGGYNLFAASSAARKNYTVFTPHYALKVAIRVYFIDTLDNNNDYFKLSIDGTERISENPIN